MKICLTVNSSPWSRFKGGGQIAVHYLATALVKKGHEVLVLYSKCPDEVINPSTDYRIHWVRHFNVATVNLNIFSFGWALRRLARRERFEVIHGNAEEAFFNARICRKIGAVPVFTSHSPRVPATGFLGAFAQPLDLLKNVNFFLLRSAAAEAEQIVTFSRFSKHLVVEGLGQAYANRVEVIAPGIDLTWFDVNRKPSSNIDVMFWGRMEDEKGIPELLRAFKKVGANYPQARLHLVGEGNHLPDYQQMAGKLGIADQVMFHGWLEVKKIQTLAATCRLGVFPSRIESFGLVVAEAMAAKLPVICSDAGALPEIVEDGVTGTLTPAGNADKLTDAILQALADPQQCERRADAGREHIHKNFSWGMAADRLIQLYREKIGAKN